MQDLVRLSITNMDVEDMNENILASYNIMLNNENFKPYHVDIKAKIEEYNKANGVSDKKHEGIKIELKLCTFYKTINDFIVMIVEWDANNVQFIICKTGTLITSKQIGVFNSRLSDYVMQRINNVGTRYLTSHNGKFKDMEDCEHFGLHIVSQVDANFNDLKEQKA